MRFKAVIEERPGPGRPGIWAGFVLPPRFVATLRATRKDGERARRVAVRGELDGTPFRGSVRLVGGEWEFLTGLDLRDRAHVDIGDEVAVEMSEDLEERVLEPPADLAHALAVFPDAHRRWAKEPWSHRRELVTYLDDAKRPETRTRRIGRIVDALREKAGGR